ncbi:MAG: GNAT family N-acetyltransferase [Planctomycetota bacterium]|nr:GNAT family N-acetyltransferase [Planctomycetota bacterium]
MNVTIQRPTRKAEAMLARVLRDGDTLAAEYPLVFGDGAVGQLSTIEAGGEPVAGCAFLTRTFQVGALRIPIGLIGSVATDPAHRGQGHASQALEQAQQSLARSGCAFALLWADDPDFYGPRGWLPMGTEVNHALPFAVAHLLPDPIGVRPARVEDIPSMHALYCAHTTRVERTLAETEQLLGAPNMTTLVLEREGTVVAYACEGRGKDLGGVIHEWAGVPLDALAVVRGHLERTGSNLILMSSRDATGVFRYLQVLGIQANLGILGMGKVISLEACAEVLRAALPGIDLTLHPDSICIHGPAGEANLDETMLLLLLAAPRGIRDMAEAVEQLTGVSMAALPLAPFCWGLDSI